MNRKKNIKQINERKKLFLNFEKSTFCWLQAMISIPSFKKKKRDFGHLSDAAFFFFIQF